MKNNIFTLLLIAIFSFVITACEKEGSAEKAGEAIDENMQEASDKLKEASEE
jgi:hypothetical protein